MKEDKPVLDDAKVIEVKIKRITLGSVNSLVWCVLKPWHFIGRGTLCRLITELFEKILEGKK